ATIGGMLDEQSLVDWARRAALYEVRRQQQDGSWAYGADSHQSWADNFHTAYILTSLARIHNAISMSPAEAAADESRKDFDNAMHHGYDFWSERFFLTNGWSKYFPDRLYPVD